MTEADLPEEKVPESEAEPKKRPRGKRWIKLAIWILVPIAVLCAVWFGGGMLFPKVFNTDTVTRFFRYMGLKNKEGYGQIHFEADSSNVLAGFGNGLVVADKGSLTFYDLEGGQSAFVQASLQAPVLCVGEEACALYCPGSKYLAVLDRDGTVLTDGETDGKLLDVDLSEDGYLAAVTVQSGYKAVVSVRNPKQDPMYVFYSRTSYINACAVSEKGSRLALSVLSEAQGTYHSRLTILRTSEEIADLTEDSGAAAHADLGNQMVYDLRFLDDTHLCAICQNELVFLDADGKILRTISTADKTLLDYGFSENGFAVMTFRSSRDDEQDLMLILDENGKTVGELRSPARILSVSVKGRYLALLTEACVELYDKQLRSYYRTEDVSGALHVFARSDGTMILATDSSTRLLIP